MTILVVMRVTAIVPLVAELVAARYISPVPLRPALVNSTVLVVLAVIAVGAKSRVGVALVRSNAAIAAVAAIASAKAMSSFLTGRKMRNLQGTECLRGSTKM